MKNNVIYRIILAGMLLGNPAVMMPMELNSSNSERQCTVCFNDEPESNFPELACGHNGACVYCLRYKLKMGLVEEWRQALRHLCCPQNGCEHIINEADIRKIDASRTARYSDVMLMLNAGRADSTADLINCPTRDCRGMYLREANRWNVQCEVCSRVYCSRCQRLHDVDENGNEISECPAANQLNNNNNNNLTDEDRRRLEREQREHNAWLQDNAKSCPRCNVVINKDGGCNHMTCRNANCAYEFCWVCLEPWALNDNHPTFYRCLGRPNNNNNALNNNNNQNDNDPVYEYVPQAVHVQQRYESHRRNYTPIIVVGTIAIAAGAAYGAYKLYKYFYPPKPAEEKDLKANLNDLHQEAIKSRARMNGAQGYAAGLLKDYFVAQEAKGAYKDLDAEKLMLLKTIIDDLEFGLIAGNCDKQYATLVKFLLDVDAPQRETVPNKPVPQRPVLVKQQPHKFPKKKAVRVQSTKNRRNKAKA